MFDKGKITWDSKPYLNKAKPLIVFNFKHCAALYVQTERFVFKHGKVKSNNVSASGLKIIGMQNSSA